ncbi:MAG: hypothetical protein IKE74_06260 [Mogibacterium sp.]|nr:hypothetical protein [Mogibacterium sp.]
MTGNTQRENNLIRAYIIISATLLVLIKTVQIMHAGRVINVCMFTAIAVNTAVTAYFYLRCGRTIEDRNSNLIAYGLFATFVADLFATLFARGFNSTPYIIGISCFCVVEIIYAAYLRAGRATVILRVAVIAAVLIILRAAGMFKTGIALGLINIILVMANVLDAWVIRRFDAPMLFRIGIALFCACDLSIAIRTVTSGGIHQAAAFVVWIFYVPAQLLITLAYVSCCSNKRD